MLLISVYSIMKTAFSCLVAYTKMVEPVLKKSRIYITPVLKSTVSYVKWAIIGIPSYFSEKKSLL